MVNKLLAHFYIILVDGFITITDINKVAKFVVNTGTYVKMLVA